MHAGCREQRTGTCASSAARAASRPNSSLSAKRVRQPYRRLFAPCEIASAHGLSFCAHSRGRQRGNRGNRSAAVVSRPARTRGSNETDLGGERGHLRFLIMARCSRCDPAKLVTSVQLALRSASFHSLNARTSYEKKGPRFRWT